MNSPDAAWRHATVTHAAFIDDHMYVVLTDSEGEQHEVYVPNGTFCTENPTLQLLAYCGAKPSTVQSEFVGSHVPLAHDGEILQQVYGSGKHCLTDAAWMQVQLVPHA